MITKKLKNVTISKNGIPTITILKKSTTPKYISRNPTEVKISTSPVTNHGVVRNLNTHIVTVRNDRVDVTYKENKERPIIRYEHIPDTSKPGDAYILRTVAIDGLPLPKEGLLYLVNRDTVAATRKIEGHMRKDAKYDSLFVLVDANPDNWRQLIKAENNTILIREMLKYVQRYDLRAPGEQVRNSDNRISHCKELISEFD
jgi:hypothetical protein